MIRCSKCNSEISDLCEARFCPLCGAALDTTPAESSAVSPAQDDNVPWETAAEGSNLAEAFLKTARNVLFQPTLFFKALRPQTNWWWPLVFALIVSTISSLATFGWNQVWLSWLPGWLLQFEPYLQNQTAASLLWSPLWCLCQIFFAAVFLQATLVVFHRRERNNFSMTFRMLSYMQSTQLFSLIPFMGPFIAAVFWLYLLITGLRFVHRMSTMKAVAIFIAPMVLLIMLMLLTMILIVAGGFITLQLLKDFIVNFRY